VPPFGLRVGAHLFWQITADYNGEAGCGQTK
jgi:hypothetical protein